MSDYTREKWLWLRSIQPKPPLYVHVSKHLIWTPNGTVLSRGFTYKAGRRKEKNLIWAVKQAAKAERRALKKKSPTAGIHTPTVA